ncbi:hypothetical protein D9M70_519860 [compost metagenome]
MSRGGRHVQRRPAVRRSGLVAIALTQLIMTCCGVMSVRRGRALGNGNRTLRTADVGQTCWLPIEANQSSALLRMTSRKSAVEMKMRSGWPRCSDPASRNVGSILRCVASLPRWTKTTFAFSLSRSRWQSTFGNMRERKSRSIVAPLPAITNGGKCTLSGSPVFAQKAGMISSRRSRFGCLVGSVKNEIAASSVRAKR